MTHPEHARPVSQERRRGLPAPWAVVRLRLGRDNRRRRRVYRDIWSFETLRPARLCHERMVEWCRGHLLDGHVALVERGVLAGAATGCIDLVEEWVLSRRGVNLDADPWSSARYLSRERPETRDVTYTEAGETPAGRRR